MGRPPEHVHSPALTIGLTIQPDVLQGLAGKPGFRGRGLLARFQFCLPRSGIGYRKIVTPPVHPGDRAGYHRVILGLFRHFESPSRDLGPAAGPENPLTVTARAHDRAGTVTGTGPGGYGTVTRTNAEGYGTVTGTDPEGYGTVTGTDPEGYGTVTGTDPEGYGTVTGTDPEGYGTVTGTDPEGYGTVTGTDPEGYGTVTRTDAEGYGTVTGTDPRVTERNRH